MTVLPLKYTWSIKYRRYNSESLSSDSVEPTGTKRERTRAALVAATLAVLSEKGFAGASLDEIAARAGMTKGAIYSNYQGKAELLLAAMHAKALSLTTNLPADAPLRERLEEMARNLVGMIGRARTEARLLAEFQLYALSDPELRGAVAEMYAEAFTGGAAFFGRLKDLKSGVQPRHLAVALQSVAIGLAVQSFMTPDEVTEDAILTVFRGLADGVVAEG